MPTTTHKTQPTHSVIPAKAGIHTTQPAPTTITPTPNQDTPMTPKEIKSALKAGWDAMSPSYQADSQIALDDVHYAPFAPGETFYKLMGDVTNKRILELACGAAQNSIALTNWGANVVALDFSPNQLTRALTNKRKTETDLHLIAGDMESPTMFKPGSFDIILSSFGWEFIPDLTQCLTACADILRPGGQLIMATVHPLSAFSWDIRDQSLRVTDYFNPPIEIWDDPVPDGHPPGLTFFRTIEELTTSLTSAGLLIDRLIEPCPLSLPDGAQSPYAGPYWSDHYTRLTQIPFAILISTHKPTTA